MSKLAHAGASSTTPDGLRQLECRCHRLVQRCRRRAPSIDIAQRLAAPAAFASPIATTALPRAADRSAQQPQIAALEPSADDRHEHRSEALDRPHRRFDVGRLRVVHEPDAVELRRPAPSRARGQRMCRPRAVIARRRRRRQSPPTVAAAITSSTRCAPSRWIAIERHQRSCCRRSSSLDDPAVFDRPSRRRSRRVARKQPPRAPCRARKLEHRLVVGVDDREVARAAGSRRSAPSPPHRPRRS